MNWGMDSLSHCILKMYGGGGGNRTRVRQFSAFGSTCLVHLLFNLSLAR